MIKPNENKRKVVLVRGKTTYRLIPSYGKEEFSDLFEKLIVDQINQKAKDIDMHSQGSDTSG